MKQEIQKIIKKLSDIRIQYDSKAVALFAFNLEASNYSIEPDVLLTAIEAHDEGFAKEVRSWMRLT